VGYNVPQTGDFVPFHIGIAGSHLRWYVLNRFANDLEIAHDGIEGLFVLYKLVQV
jgi:hypothetical protein